MKKISKKRLHFIMNAMAVCLILLPMLYVYIFLGCRKLVSEPICSIAVPTSFIYACVVVLLMRFAYWVIKNKWGIS